MCPSPAFLFSAAHKASALNPNYKNTAVLTIQGKGIKVMTKVGDSMIAFVKDLGSVSNTHVLAHSS